MNTSVKVFRCCLVLSLIFSGFVSVSQTFEYKLEWKSALTTQGQTFAVCAPCDLHPESNQVYWYFVNQTIEGFSLQSHSIQIHDPNYVKLDFVDQSIENELKQTLLKASIPADSVMQMSFNARGVPILAFRFPAIILQDNQLHYLQDYKVIVKKSEGGSLAARPYVNRRNQWPSVSVLATGPWYKLGVDREGFFRVDKNYLESLGVNLSEVDPRTIKVFGNHGDMLPEDNGATRSLDLNEVAIWVEGESDGVFNNSDFIVFYGRPPSKFNVDTQTLEWRFHKNIYATESVYFLTFGGSPGLRMSSAPHNASQSAQWEVNALDDVHRHEQDLVNHIKSGRQWYGEHFDRVLSHSISHSFANRMVSEPVRVKAMLVARSTQQSAFTLNLNGQTRSLPISALSSLSYEMPFVNVPAVAQLTFENVSGSSLNLNISYNKPLSTSEGWLDFIEFHVKKQSIHSGSQMRVASFETRNFSSSRFKITGSSSMRVFNVSDPNRVVIQQTDFQNNQHVFVHTNNQNVPHFMSVTSYFTPKPIGRINNQNLHGARDIDYIVITHRRFRDAARDLADFHAAQNGFTTYVADVEEIYNEFSSGIQDLSAIRDFIKMIWDEASSADKKPKHVLLFGDASYDYLDILNNNTNYVPTYQSLNSHNPNSSFCSDDFFALMDNNEPRMNQPFIGMLDLGVGRLPASSGSEAQAMVNKIKNYHSAEAMGNWRNNFTFVADDMDKAWEDVFVFDSERFINHIRGRFAPSTFTKIYLDAYEQQSLGGAQRYPDAVRDINNGIDRGTLMWTYNGHGGVFGLASERIIEIPQVRDWSNRHRLPVFMTATCELSRYDDPGMKSAGEEILLNPSGGGIGLLTTTRLVFVSTNSVIGNHFFQNALFGSTQPTGERFLGEIYRTTKNRSGSGVGDRHFTYLGDPAVMLALPKYTLVLDSLNDKAFGSGPVDTLKALSRVTFKGRIVDQQGQIMNDFNGTVFPSVFDKPNTVFTRLNDLQFEAQQDTNIRPIAFDVQNNILFNGRSRVNQGRFQFTFMVPKDINYRFDSSRISLYAHDLTRDAAGVETGIVVGGSVDTANLDNEGPTLELFMNDLSFVNGGITDRNPLFIATLFDVSGINTAGSGIGREIIATVDKGTRNEKTLILNEFYQAAEDSYQEGEIRYRLGELSPGEHTITLKAWDVFNNSSEVSLEFVVEDNEDLVLSNVLNYPNPFSTRTEFHMDHNKPGQDIVMHVQIMTISGRVVKSFFSEFPVAESHLVPFEWDGKDEFGDVLARGVYIYRVRAQVKGGKWAEKYEKLVILN